MKGMKAASLILGSFITGAQLGDLLFSSFAVGSGLSIGIYIGALVGAIYGLWLARKYYPPQTER